jgi:hypothetical protein
MRLENLFLKTLLLTLPFAFVAAPGCRSSGPGAAKIQTWDDRDDEPERRAKSEAPSAQEDAVKKEDKSIPFDERPCAIEAKEAFATDQKKAWTTLVACGREEGAVPLATLTRAPWKGALATAGGALLVAKAIRNEKHDVDDVLAKLKDMGIRIHPLPEVFEHDAVLKNRLVIVRGAFVESLEEKGGTLLVFDEVGLPSRAKLFAPKAAADGEGIAPPTETATTSQEADERVAPRERQFAVVVDKLDPELVTDVERLVVMKFLGLKPSTDPDRQEVKVARGEVIYMAPMGLN